MGRLALQLLPSLTSFFMSPCSWKPALMFGALIDYSSRAFDTINHNKILFVKLNKLSIRHLIVRWFTSFLSTKNAGLRFLLQTESPHIGCLCCTMIRSVTNMIWSLQDLLPETCLLLWRTTHFPVTLIVFLIRSCSKLFLSWLTDTNCSCCTRPICIFWGNFDYMPFFPYQWYCFLFLYVSAVSVTDVLYN